MVTRWFLNRYNFDNNMDGYYIAPAFMDKLVVHITKNFMTLPNIKVDITIKDLTMSFFHNYINCRNLT